MGKWGYGGEGMSANRHIELKRMMSFAGALGILLLLVFFSKGFFFRPLDRIQDKELKERAAAWESCCKPVPPPLASVTAENFRFENYGTEKALQLNLISRDAQSKALLDALNKLFPVGTDKEAVEKILVDTAHARAEHVMDRIRYFHDGAIFPENKCKPGWVVTVQYNLAGKVKAVGLSGSGCISRDF